MDNSTLDYELVIGRVGYDNLRKAMLKMNKVSLGDSLSDIRNAYNELGVLGQSVVEFEALRIGLVQKGIIPDVKPEELAKKIYEELKAMTRLTDRERNFRITV